MNKKNIAPQWGEDRVGEFVKQFRRRGVTGEHVQRAIVEKGSRRLERITYLLRNESGLDDYSESFVRIAVRLCCAIPWKKSTLLYFLSCIPVEIQTQVFDALIAQLQKEVEKASANKNLRTISNITINLTELEEFFAASIDKKH